MNGSYWVMVIDLANNCLVIVAYEIGVIVLIVVEVLEFSLFFFGGMDGSILVIVSGGILFYLYEWLLDGEFVFNVVNL